MKPAALIASIACIIFFQACHTPPNRYAQADKLPDLPKEDITAVEKIAAEIASHGGLESAYVGFGGTPSQQWERYEKLRETATIDQLVAFTDDATPAVRCYAFRALAARRSDQVFPVLLRHLQDSAWVQSMSGCIMGSEQVRDYFLSVVAPGAKETDVYTLNASQQQIVDSILGHRWNPLERLFTN